VVVGAEFVGAEFVGAEFVGTGAAAVIGERCRLEATIDRAYSTPHRRIVLRNLLLGAHPSVT
jgi:hypothetical protein